MLWTARVNVGAIQRSAAAVDGYWFGSLGVPYYWGIYIIYMGKLFFVLMLVLIYLSVGRDDELDGTIIFGE